VFTEHWTRLLLAYARHRGLFMLRIEDAEVSAGAGGGEWDEVLRNPRINRASCASLRVRQEVIKHDGHTPYLLMLGRLKSEHLAHILSIMASKNLAAYEPAKQTRAALLYWRLPEEWAEVLHEWVRATFFPQPQLFLYFIGSRGFSPRSSSDTCVVP